MIKSVSIPAFLAAGIFCVIATNSAIDSRKVMLDKAQAQETSVNDFNQWKAQYTNLLPVEEKWNKSIQPAIKVKDLYSLHGILGETPNHNPDTIVVDRIEPFLLNDKPTGASKVCFHSSTSSGMQFFGDKPSILTEQISELAKRPDISFSVMEMGFDNTGKLSAVLKDFCVILKD